MSDVRIEVPGVGPVELVTKAELDAFECNCGEPGCRGDSMTIRTTASDKVEAVYYKNPGCVVIFCSCCGKPHIALRVL